MKRILFSFFVFFLFIPKAYASDPNFDISVDSLYEVESSGETTVTQTISIKNKTEFYYTPTYTVSVGFDDVQNVSAVNNDGVIPTTISQNPGGKSIKMNFPNRYAGLSEVNKFTLSFTTSDIAKKQGNVWEIQIPGIEKPEDFMTYTARILVPEDFGKASIVKPKASGSTFSKNEIGESGIYMLYGDKQYYSFSLNYNISNPNLFPVRTEIALPPSTGYQNVILSSFSEDPINVVKDADGNWIAEYRLLPQQKKIVNVKGVIEVLSLPKEASLTNQQIKAYTAPKKYWDSKDPEILRAAESLDTPQEIYEFVIEKLSYNYSKIATDNLRLGGKGSMRDPKNSVCLEFSDLFVSLARARGIPARSVEGYAYTQNPQLRPLSLVNDILHAWPEYYDTKSKKWIMVDPTWGKTTKGMDYFTTLDFSHVAFAVKGTDSEYPIPAGGYKFSNESKDVTVTFAKKEDFKMQQKFSITDNFPNFSFPKIALQGSFEVKNTGNSALSNLTAIVTSNYNVKREFNIDYVPPRGVRRITTTFDVPFLTNNDYIITIRIGNHTQTKAIRISFIPDTKFLIIIGGLISGSLIIAAVTFHTGSVFVQRRKRKNSLRR